jgi:hypothetical protein
MEDGTLEPIGGRRGCARDRRPGVSLQLRLDFNQRWNRGRASYRPPRETIRTSDYEIAEIADDTTARTFVIAHHCRPAKNYPCVHFTAIMFPRHLEHKVPIGPTNRHHRQPGWPAERPNGLQRFNTGNTGR